jgi:hypothetical protein
LAQVCQSEQRGIKKSGTHVPWFCVHLLPPSIADHRVSERQHPSNTFRRVSERQHPSNTFLLVSERQHPSNTFPLVSERQHPSNNFHRVSTLVILSSTSAPF